MWSIRSGQKQEVERRLGCPNTRNDSMLPFMRRQVEEIERLKDSQGSESEIVLNSISEIVKEMISVYSEYENARVKAFTALEFNTINTPEDIGKSIERAKQAEMAANKMDRLNKEMGMKLKESFLGSRVTPSDTNPTIQNFYRTADIERISELYKMNAETMREVRLVMQVMEKEWGAWEYNVKGGSVLFESESTVIEFNNTMKHIGILVQKVKALQLEILETQAGDSG